MVKEIERILKEAGIEDYGFEAKILADEESPLEKAKKRATGYPLQYILGEWEFYGLPFKVNEQVLIPRADTEILVEQLLLLAKEKDRVLDLCSGSGCIAITAAKHGLEATGLEISPGAIEVARENARLNEVEVNFLQGDVFTFNEDTGKFNFIVSNPPYLTKEDMLCLQREVTFEPEGALFGGEDGLRFYEFIEEHYYPYLEKGGYIIFEIGCSQAKAVSKLLEKRYGEIRVIKDYSGLDRVVIGRKEE